MIFIDSNVPMYLVGAAHPHKVHSQTMLERLIADRERLASDAEVLQEILHSYSAIERREAIQPAFDALLGVVDEVFPIEPRDVEAAKTILLSRYKLSARHAIHLAVMKRHRIDRVFSFDRGFEAYPGIHRIPEVD